MESSTHSLRSLFDQLGLRSDSIGIERFIKMHGPMATYVYLADAAFWTTAQASFLSEEILKDADWVEVIDKLNIMLH
jgi:hypothetical protein